MLYYFLKPSTTTNDTGSGSNANAVSPEPISTNYSSGSPAQTSAGIGFRTGETNAFVSGNGTYDYYWVSTDGGAIQTWVLSFYNGYQSNTYVNKSNSVYVRAVRRIPV